MDGPISERISQAKTDLGEGLRLMSLPSWLSVTVPWGSGPHYMKFMARPGFSVAGFTRPPTS